MNDMGSLDRLVRELANLQQEKNPVSQALPADSFESDFKQIAQEDESKCYRFKWLPGLNAKMMAPLSPSEVCTFTADTGTGKTLTLQRIALDAFPMKVLFVELELSGALLMHRWLSMVHKIHMGDVLKIYKDGGKLESSEAMKNVKVFFKPGATPPQIEEQIELMRPGMVIVDYLQLVGAPSEIRGSRYEKASYAAEELKTIASRQNVIMIEASQIHRKKEEKNSHEVGTHDGRDSSSIENSTQLGIGVWKDKANQNILHMRINKATRNQPGTKIKCKFDGGFSLIEEIPEGKTEETQPFYERWDQK